MKQLEEYEEAVMQKRLAEMPAEDVERLMREVRTASRAECGIADQASARRRKRPDQVAVAEKGLAVGLCPFAGLHMGSAVRQVPQQAPQEALEARCKHRDCWFLRVRRSKRRGQSGPTSAAGSWRRSSAARRRSYKRTSVALQWACPPVDKTLEH